MNDFNQYGYGTSQGKATLALGRSTPAAHRGGAKLMGAMNGVPIAKEDMGEEAKARA